MSDEEALQEARVEATVHPRKDREQVHDPVAEHLPQGKRARAIIRSVIEFYEAEIKLLASQKSDLEWSVANLTKEANEKISRHRETIEITDRAIAVLRRLQDQDLKNPTRTLANFREQARSVVKAWQAKLAKEF